MHVRLVTAGTALLSLVVTGLAGLTVTAAPAHAASADVRVGTFNIVTVSADAASGDRRPWRERRGVVIGQILGQGLDVVGLQEANQSTIYGSRLVDDKRNQYLDLRNGLNRAGGAYQVSQRLRLQLRQGLQLAELPLPQPRGQRGQPDPLQHPHPDAAAQGLLQVPPPGGRQERPLPRLGRVPGQGDRSADAVHHDAPRPLQPRRPGRSSGAT